MRSLFAALALLLAVPALSATLWVTEFAGASSSNPVFYQAVKAPALAVQTVAVGGSSTQSAVFNTLTGIVRVTCDVACLVELGTNPTAVAASMRLTAGAAEYFVVPAGYRLAVLVAP